MATTILAADLGKYNSVFCWFEPDTRTTTFRTVKTTPELLRAELLRQPVSQVVFEACSQAGWVHDRCEELKLTALVASTIGAAWQWKRVKRKTDRDDALKLARLAAVGEIGRTPSSGLVPPRPVAQPVTRVCEWRSTIEPSRCRLTCACEGDASEEQHRRS